MEKLTEYCKHDVEITRDLFEYGLKNGHLIYKAKQADQRVRLRVDWNLENMLKKS
jgi:DEAD/DEAH box helicase domain-containing protein